MNQVAIIVNEDEYTIRELAKRMHLWVAGTEKNRVVVESLWKESGPEDISVSKFVVPEHSSREDMCITAIDLIEDHHSSVTSAGPWLEIQVHGCTSTKKLVEAFSQFDNAEIKTQVYGFNVTRPCE